MVRCLIAIGSNTGDCRQHIQHAVSQIGRLADTKVLSVSQLLETAPVGSNTDQVFLNGAVAIETKRPALQLIQDLLEIEHSGGRDRKSGSGNRPIDLDILLYGDQVIAEPGLEVPHPRMTFRRFVLEPAVEIAAEMPHPITDCCLQDLLSRLQKQRNVIVVHTPSTQWLQQMQTASLENHHSQNQHQPLALWCFAEPHRETVGSMRKALSTEGDWWVWVVESPQNSLAFAGEAAKLNIYVGNKSDKTQPFVATTPQQLTKKVPYWCLQLAEPEQIIGSVETAMQSMLPLES